MKRLPAAFYQLPSGREPVREWLKALDEADRKIIGEDIKDVEFSWPIGMPLVRPLGDGPWEVRSDMTLGRIARVIFFHPPRPHGAAAWICEEGSEDAACRP